jgi:hypothetical protein
MLNTLKRLHQFVCTAYAKKQARAALSTLLTSTPDEAAREKANKDWEALMERTGNRP